MKSKLQILALVAFTSFGTARASADYSPGAFGIGVESPLGIGPLIVAGTLTSRLPGLSMRMQLSESFGLQAILAYRVGAVRDNGPADTKTSLFGTFLRAHFAAIRHDVVALGLFGGLGFTNAKSNPPGPGDSVSRIITIEFGLRPEVWIADRASIHFQLGLSFAIVRGDTGVIPEGFGLVAAHNADLLGGAGLTVWIGGDGATPVADEPEGGGPEADPGYGAPPPQNDYGTQPTYDQQPPPQENNEPPPDWESGDPGF